VIGLTALASGATPARADTARAANPKTWDPRVAAIATSVERLRGLKFAHPVPVRFLADADFAAAQKKDSRPTAADKADLERSQNILRALGLIGPDVDLQQAADDLQSSDVLAYYDPAKKRVTIRGADAGNVATRVSVAHELTHALQDQHFGLDGIARNATKQHAETVSRAIIEGDAIRVQNLYEQQLSAADQAAYDAVTKTETANAQAAVAAHHVPDALVALVEAPYDFGPSLVTVAGAKLAGGVDALFRHPPTTDAAFLTPSSVVEHASFVTVPPPALGPGERRVGHPDVFGSYGLYVVLATRIDASDALRVADGWAGDGMVTFTRKAGTGTEACLRAAFAGRTSSATAAIGAALTTWSAAMPQGATSVVAKGGRIVLTACDTGAAVPAGARSASEAETFAATRDALYATVVKDGSPSAQATCAADRIVRDAVFAPVLADPSATPSASQLAQIQTRAAAIGLECRSAH
jgi:hypothetical protein